LSDPYEHSLQAESVLSYDPYSLPKKQFLELKKGHLAWQARLDLHGLRPDAARERLLSFMLQQQAEHHRCLLIIHGKGGRHGEPPILKNLVHHWLRQIPQVLAFHSAIPRDGGTGAVYVLLRRTA
jgi:DNA-nicking Smr family endonuclease